MKLTFNKLTSLRITKTTLLQQINRTQKNKLMDTETLKSVQRGKTFKTG